ncbi:MAG TPA: apolipoprotein N-acyltransferase [Lentisphaeria bacterium]|nr:MAG: apolipoprotein N-acyltransferase [Lentisphaerae bacterium GWF2_49_21]HBC86542.1 apolipoprotein N-acyltransferase [Lentisphaeria bacterium]
MNKDIQNIDKTAAELRETELENKAGRVGNEWWEVSMKRTWLRLVLLAGSALLYAAAFPPLNWSSVGWFGIIPLFWLVKGRTVRQAWFDGFIWGYVWSCTAFFFLREIEVFVPFAIAFIFALFPAFWAASVPLLRRFIFVPVDVQLKGCDAERDYYNNEKHGHWKKCLFVLVLAAWWCVLEWTRNWLFSGFPWDLLAGTQWKNIALLQICEFTGVYGLSFVLIYFNISLALAMEIWKNIFMYRKFERPIPFYVAIALLAITFVSGSYSVLRTSGNKEKATLDAVVIQADIPQCRMANDQQARFALDEYMSLSENAVLLKPDLVIWPETAVPVPYNLADDLAMEYRSRLGGLIIRNRIPFLIGTIDFGKYIPPMRPQDIPIYNSAIFIDRDANIVDSYNKIHLVPWGEYTPLGEYYPWIKKKFGMGRSLTPGRRATIFNIKENVRAGMNICFEDVFPELARNCALAGANLLIIISNDAWYPKSSEPEQHLAHAVFRAVEIRRPIIRAGNNSGSCVISPTGAITQSISFSSDDKKDGNVLDPLQKIKGFANFRVEVIADAPLTFYTKYGNVFIYFCILVCIGAGTGLLWAWREKKQKLLEAFEKKQ